MPETNDTFFTRTKLPKTVKELFMAWWSISEFLLHCWNGWVKFQTNRLIVVVYCLMNNCLDIECIASYSLYLRKSNILAFGMVSRAVGDIFSIHSDRTMWQNQQILSSYTLIPGQRRQSVVITEFGWWNLRKPNNLLYILWPTDLKIFILTFVSHIAYLSFSSHHIFSQTHWILF